MVSLSEKKDKAAKLKAELENIQKEIEREEEIETLKTLLSDLRNHWEVLLKNRLAEPTRDYDDEDKIADLKKRMTDILGPPEWMEKAFEESRKESKKRNLRTCSGGMMSYCAPSPEGNDG